LFKTYIELFKTPGAKRIASAGFIARLPIAMDTLAIILFVQSVDGRYAVAGSLTAVAALVTVISAPLWSKAADHIGQRPVLTIAVPIRILSIITFIALVKNGAPIWSWFIAIFIAESASVSIGSMTRRRWVHLIADEKKVLLSTSYAFESLLDEFIYILGPVITTAVVAAVSPVAGLVLGIIFLVIGAPTLAAHSRSDPGIEHRNIGEKHKSVFRNRKLQAVAIPLTIAGGAFSAVNISVVAFSEERGSKSISGVLLGIWAVGGAVSALINGSITWKISHGSRYLAYLFGMTAISLTFPFLENFYQLGIALFLQGLCIAPLLPNGLPLVTNSVPPSQMTQAITLATAGIPLTGALSSFLSGQSIDRYGASTTLWLPFGFLACASAATLFYLKEYKS
jgi:MFS family permease